MIFFPESKSTFIHIPKCAGTTIRYALKESIPLSPFLYWGKGFHTFERKNIDFAHLSAIQAFLEPLSLINSNYRFAVVRDPYDRFLSAVSELYERGVLIKYGVKEYDEALTYIMQNGLSNLDLDGDFIHLKPQSQFTHIRGFSVVNDVFYQNNITFCFDKIKSMLDNKVEFISRNIRRNDSQRKITGDIKEFVDNEYVNDVEFFELKREEQNMKSFDNSEYINFILTAQHLFLVDSKQMTKEFVYLLAKHGFNTHTILILKNISENCTEEQKYYLLKLSSLNFSHNNGVSYFIANRCNKLDELFKPESYREQALSYENKDLPLALFLMELALALRPTGPLLNKKIHEYKSILSNINDN